MDAWLLLCIAAVLALGYITGYSAGKMNEHARCVQLYGRWAAGKWPEKRFGWADEWLLRQELNKEEEPCSPQD